MARFSWNFKHKFTHRIRTHRITSPPVLAIVPHKFSNRKMGCQSKLQLGRLCFPRTCLLRQGLSLSCELLTAEDSNYQQKCPQTRHLWDPPRFKNIFFYWLGLYGFYSWWQSLILPQCIAWEHKNGGEWSFGSTIIIKNTYTSYTSFWWPIDLSSRPTSNETFPLWAFLL